MLKRAILKSLYLKNNEYRYQFNSRHSTLRSFALLVGFTYLNFFPLKFVKLLKAIEKYRLNKSLKYLQFYWPLRLIKCEKLFTQKNFFHCVEVWIEIVRSFQLNNNTSSFKVLNIISCYAQMIVLYQMQGIVQFLLISS